MKNVTHLEVVDCEQRDRGLHRRGLLPLLALHEHLLDDVPGQLHAAGVRGRGPLQGHAAARHVGHLSRVTFYFRSRWLNLSPLGCFLLHLIS